MLTKACLSRLQSTAMIATNGSPLSRHWMLHMHWQTFTFPGEKTKLSRWFHIFLTYSQSLNTSACCVSCQMGFHESLFAMVFVRILFRKAGAIRLYCNDVSYIVQMLYRRLLLYIFIYWRHNSRAKEPYWSFSNLFFDIATNSSCYYNERY